MECQYVRESRLGWGGGRARVWRHSDTPEERKFGFSFVRKLWSRPKEWREGAEHRGSHHLSSTSAISTLSRYVKSIWKPYYPHQVWKYRGIKCLFSWKTVDGTNSEQNCCLRCATAYRNDKHVDKREAPSITGERRTAEIWNIFEGHCEESRTGTTGLRKCTERTPKCTGQVDHTAFRYVPFQ